MNSEYYNNVLQNALLLNAKKMAGSYWIFQQDNAAVHTSHVIKTFLEANDVYVLDWPAKSPDLNIIENVWELLARKVYAEVRQFDSVCDLQDTLVEVWNGMDLVYL